MKKEKVVFREIVGEGKCPKRKGSDKRHGFVLFSWPSETFYRDRINQQFCRYKCRFCRVTVKVPYLNALKIEQVARGDAPNQEGLTKYRVVIARAEMVSPANVTCAQHEIWVKDDKAAMRQANSIVVESCREGKKLVIYSIVEVHKIIYSNVP